MITADDAQYAYDIVKTICAEVGPGLPGTSQERERAAIIARELESHLGAENVVTEEFTLAPGAFLGWAPASALLTLAAALLNTFAGRLAGIPPLATALVALALVILAMLPAVFEFILFREFVDPFFKKKQSVNVIGALRKPGTQTAKRLLILGGHHDSALENTWLRFLGYGFFFVTLTLAAGPIVMLAMCMIQAAGVIAGAANLVRIGTIGWPMWVYPIVPYVVFTLFFTGGRRNGGTVPGAADNLAASALTVAMCRFLIQNPAYIPDDAKIRFI